MIEQIKADFTYTDVFSWNYQSKYRYNINQGGTWSSKTRSLVQCMLMHAINDPGSKGTIAGQDWPHLRDGALDDFEETWAQSQMLKDAIRQYHKTEHKIFFHNGSTVTFKSYRSEQAAKAGKREYLFVNEANGIPYGIYGKLEERTSKKVYIDYNPDAEFWAHRQVLPKDNATRFISNCFEHNEYCPPAIRSNVLDKGQLDNNYLRVYGYGLTGKTQGLVFKRVHAVDDFPTGARLVGYGLDWGYSKSPTAVVKMGVFQGKIYGQQIVYDIELSTEELADQLRTRGVKAWDLILADPEDPKSIADLKAHGFNVIGADKGPGSKKYSIKLLNGYPSINLTHSSQDWLDEANRYKYKKDNKGDWTEEPIKQHDHCWDAARYWAMTYINVRRRRGQKPQAGAV